MSLNWGNTYLTFWESSVGGTRIKILESGTSGCALIFTTFEIEGVLVENGHAVEVSVELLEEV